MAWRAGTAARPESPGFRRGLLFNWDATFGGGIAPVRAARRGGIVPGLHNPTRRHHPRQKAPDGSPGTPGMNTTPVATPSRPCITQPPRRDDDLIPKRDDALRGGDIDMRRIAQLFEQLLAILPREPERPHVRCAEPANNRR